MRCAAFAGVLAMTLLGASSPRAAADEPLQRLLYVISPDAAGGRGGKGIYVFDVDNGHKLVRKIDLPLKGLRGVCGSASMGRLWISHGDTTILCLDLHDGQGPLGKDATIARTGAIASHVPPTARKSTCPTAPGRAPANGKS